MPLMLRMPSLSSVQVTASPQLPDFVISGSSMVLYLKVAAIRAVLLEPTVTVFHQVSVYR